MTLLLLLGTVLGVGALLFGAVVLLMMHAPARAGILAAAAGGWSVAYAALVIGSSLLSHDEILGPGQPKRFCGFYLDCHVGVAVIGDSISVGQTAVTHLVTLRFSSTARRETLTPWHVEMFVQGPDGTRYPAGSIVGGTGLEQPIPAGGSYDIRATFEVPRSLTEPRLMVRQGGDLMFPEIVLIGDEASLLHRKTWLALPS